MGAGVHTSRVERNVSRIAESFGYNVDMTIFQKTILMTVTNWNNIEVKQTSIRKIKPTAINFQVISKLSSLSWDAYDSRLSLEQLKTRYNEIMSEPRMSRWAVLFLVSCANASFCRLFAGDYVSMGIVFIATLVAFFLRQELTAKHANHLTVFTVCSFVASLIAGIATRLDINCTTPDIALGTSVLFLIPGVPLINAIIDLLEGHILTATSRFVNASILVVCIALGLAATLLILGIDTL